MIQNELYHYGIKRRSGRYPWGSGDRPHQHDGKISGDYRLKKYTSPVSRKAMELGTQGFVTFLSTVIPGFGLIWNANAVRYSIKHNFDWKDYYKKEGEPEKLSELKKKEKKTSIYEDLKTVNQKTGISNKGRVNNCVCCTAAMEMRQRGYDAIARSRGAGFSSKDYDNWFDGIEFKNTGADHSGKNRKEVVNLSYNRLCNAIEQEGNGSRGCMLVQYEKGNSGHSFYWTVENGQVHFMDPQSNSTDLDKVFSLADPNSYVYARLDNVKVKNDITTIIMSNKKG